MRESISLHIENHAIKAIIGVLPEERLKAQNLIIEAHITYEYDNTQDYLNYAHICEYITQCLQNGTYELLESALTDIANKLKKHFACITHLTLCIKKPDILAPCVVGASISREFT